MKNERYELAIDTLYNEKEKSIVIGLTGRTGAGCSTVASILSHSFEEINLQYSDEIIEQNIKEEIKELNAEEIKFRIVNKYMEPKWNRFTIIEASSIILSFLLSSPIECLINYIDELRTGNNKHSLVISNGVKLINEIKDMQHWFIEANSLLCKEKIDWDNKEEIEKLYDYYINKLPSYKKSVISSLGRYSCKRVRNSNVKNYTATDEDLYSTLWQRFGNNIRSSGNPFNDEFIQDKYLVFAKRLDDVIKIVKKKDTNDNKKHSWICIDAIRNSYESNYLKTRHSDYYLMAISTDEASRIERFDMSRSARNALDDTEYSSKSPQNQFYHQDLAACFERADIHIYNRNDNKGNFIFTKWQLIRYIALMIHPGLITPTHLERCMQLAYINKLNSGCLSRQVGAAITADDYSVKAVGWNDVPHGQVSCNLRCVDEFCSGNNTKCYSQYEMENGDFKTSINRINAYFSKYKNDHTKNRQFAYCFKDVYNGMCKTKNQVHTRALHAEENAFLQISKYGGIGLKDGILFSTASPCELCSKKAYQIGIKTIYYIDPYPGISHSHILSFGKSKLNPVMKQFFGAIGDAYINLYRQIMPVKDELELITGIRTKEIAQEAVYGETEQNNTLDITYDTMEFKCLFENRTNIKAIQKYNLRVNKHIEGVINKKFKWTGTSYVKTSVEQFEDNNHCNLLESVEEIKDDRSPYKYRIYLNRDLNEGDVIKAEVVTEVMDDGETMKPFVANVVRHPTNKLIVKLEYPLDFGIDEKSIKNHRYASEDMKILYDNPNPEQEKITINKNENSVICILEVDNPILFYTYSIEWSFG